MGPVHSPARIVLQAPALAFVGASRSGRGFGSQLLRELLRQGFRVVPVHPSADTLEGRPCCPTLLDLPELLPAVVVLPPAKAVPVLREAALAELPAVWLQQGSESPEALAVAREAGLPLVTGRCLFMDLPDVRGIHRLHRGLWRLLGLGPREA